MTAIDVPDTPNTGDTLVAGGNVWQFDGSVWVSVAFAAPNYGVADCGGPSTVATRLFNGGSPRSTYSLSSIQAGPVS